MASNRCASTWGALAECDEQPDQQLKWGPERMGRAWGTLMHRLAYERYVAQGGDRGAFVVDQMGLQQLDGLRAIHTNMPATVPTDIDRATLASEPAPPSLSDDERHA